MHSLVVGHVEARLFTIRRLHMPIQHTAIISRYYLDLLWRDMSMQFVFGIRSPAAF